MRPYESFSIHECRRETKSHPFAIDRTISVCGCFATDALSTTLLGNTILSLPSLCQTRSVRVVIATPCYGYCAGVAKQQGYTISGWNREPKKKKKKLKGKRKKGNSLPRHRRINIFQVSLIIHSLALTSQLCLAVIYMLLFDPTWNYIYSFHWEIRAPICVRIQPVDCNCFGVCCVRANSYLIFFYVFVFLLLFFCQCPERFCDDRWSNSCPLMIASDFLYCVAVEFLYVKT